MKYKGNCHCGSVNFVLESNLSKIVQCNCSYCKRRNAKMILEKKDAISIKGKENLSLYQFNTNLHMAIAQQRLELTLDILKIGFDTLVPN